MLENKKMNSKTPLFSTMHIALLLLCAVLLSSYAINGLYASFTSTETDNDGARVAKFDVVATNEKIGTDEHENSIYNVTVQNNSEVTVSYTIFSNDLPTDISLVIEDKGNGFILAPGEGTVHQVSFDDKSTTSHGDIMATITVRFEQVD